MNNPATKKKKGSRVTLAVLAVLIVTICTGYYYRDYLLLKYYDFKTNPFTSNSNVYAPGGMVNSIGKYGSFKITFYRIIRPIGPNEIDRLPLSADQKALAIQSIKTNRKSYIIRSNCYISTDSLCKYKTACIGKYKGSNILLENENEDYYPNTFYEILPNKKALIQGDLKINDLPIGYVWADNKYYIPPFDVTNQELKKFRTIK
ncbi:hypothetical protein FFF34_009440 [Inquilinus sp. KBS0705]|nr:hypothetical protein FFF34_009440 [Inquilinus sp. KBS0705]